MVGKLNAQLKGFEASCFDGVYITGDVSAADFTLMAAQRKASNDEEEAHRPHATGLAKRHGGSGMNSSSKPPGIPKVEHPQGVRRDTLAVREGLPPSQWGENSEALFLTSSFVQPDAATAAARFCQRRRGIHLFALHQSNGHDVRAGALPRLKAPADAWPLQAA